MGLPPSPFLPLQGPQVFGIVLSILTVDFKSCLKYPVLMVFGQISSKMAKKEFTNFIILSDTHTCSCFA